MQKLEFTPEDRYETRWEASFPVSIPEWGVSSIEVSLEFVESEADDVYELDEFVTFFEGILTDIRHFFFDAIDRVVADNHHGISSKEDLRKQFDGFSIGFSEGKGTAGEFTWHIQIGIEIPWDDPDAVEDPLGFGYFAEYEGRTYTGMSGAD